MDYIAVLQQLHNLILPRVYAEIGIAAGASLAVSRTHSLAIDPHFAIPGDVLDNKPWIKLYRMTSDDFFAHHLKDYVLDGARLELSFIDGLHLFEQVLRDFYHLEQWSSPDGVIAIHDVLPQDITWAYREPMVPAWTGDVWQIVPCLQKYRPDLKLRVIDAFPSGLLLVNRLDPTNTILVDQEETICQEFLGQPEPYDERLQEYLDQVVRSSPEEWLLEIRAALAL